VAEVELREDLPEGENGGGGVVEEGEGVEEVEAKRSVQRADDDVDKVATLQFVLVKEALRGRLGRGGGGLIKGGNAKRGVALMRGGCEFGGVGGGVPER
jgi:hypothetical protein